jgi:hypothetical protein
MAKVILDINDKDLETFLTILNNLKTGMISSIDIEKQRKYNKPKPIQSKPLEPTVLQKKYIDTQTYKERLKRMKQK